MKRVAFLLLMYIAPVMAQGQLADFKYLGESYFDRELYLGLSVRSSTTKNPTAPRPENHESSFWTGDFYLYRTESPQAGKVKIMFRNKVLGEIFSFLSDEEGGVNIYREEESVFTNFLMGSFAPSWYVFATDRLALSAGFNLTDFAVGSTYIVENENGVPEEVTPTPHGWYIGAGPTLTCDLLLTSWLLLETQVDYTFNFANPVPLTYGVENPDHEKPHCALLSARLMSSLGLFIGVDYSMLFDRSPEAYNIYKTDLQFGWAIML
ncbi:hypothetical protein HZ996_10250 [Cryomorphaceae bacterium]|nr:hypothetical protein HZ996_10250 [Cryomorphaceae bacterium]